MKDGESVNPICLYLPDIGFGISWQVNALSRLVDATLRPLAEESAGCRGWKFATRLPRL